MAAARIKGVLSPVVTPFKRDLSPDVGRFIAHCKWLLSQDCGLAVFGTNSEANSMSADERMGLLEAIVSAGVPTDRMMPGTGACSINEAAKVSAHATKLGVGGVLMLPPFYYKGVPEEGLFRFFSEVVQRVGDDRLRVYLYHIPPVSAVPITHKLVERLMKAYPKQIAGMKDSVGRLGAHQEHDRRLRQGRLRRLLRQREAADREPQGGRRGLSSAPRPTSIRARSPRPTRSTRRPRARSCRAGSTRCAASCRATS